MFDTGTHRKQLRLFGFDDFRALQFVEDRGDNRACHEPGYFVSPRF